MFTGIVEELGEFVGLEWHGDGGVATVRGPLAVSDVRLGDSIAVNGVCLTVVSVDGDRFTVDVLKETLDRSSLGGLSAGDPVNLERAATPVTRLGGHLVQGHVDGVGAIVSHDPLTVTLPPGLSRFVVEKGSITVDGVSLTVVSVTENEFTVSLIPTTLELTTLGRKGAGDLVNLEVDVIAKYVAKLAS